MLLCRKGNVSILVLHSLGLVTQIKLNNKLEKQVSRSGDYLIDYGTAC